MVFCFFFLKNFDLVQQALPMLDKWRYVLASKFMVNIVFIIVGTYILMRLPICKAFLNRGGVLLRGLPCTRSNVACLS